MEGPELAVGEQATNHLALIFHELATNASKYGALGRDAGRLSVSWSVDEDEIRIVWAERGGSDVATPASTGFGTKLVSTTIERIGGEIDHDWRSEGLCVRIALPAAALKT